MLTPVIEPPYFLVGSGILQLFEMDSGQRSVCAGPTIYRRRGSDGRNREHRAETGRREDGGQQRQQERVHRLGDQVALCSARRRANEGFVCCHAKNSVF